MAIATHLIMAAAGNSVGPTPLVAGDILALRDDGSIAKISSSGVVENYWVPTPSPALATCLYLLIANDGTVYRSALTNGIISKITSAGVDTRNWSTGYNNPVRMCFDSAGNIYTASQSSPGEISKTTPAGAGTPSWAITANTPYGIVADISNNIYASQANNSIVKVTPAGVVNTSWASIGTAGPAIIDGSGNIYVLQANGNKIAKVTAAGVVTANWATMTAGSNCLSFIADSSGNFYVTAYDLGQIHKVSSSGVVTNNWATVSDPRQIAIDASGNLYVTWGATTINIAKITPAGVVTSNFAAPSPNVGYITVYNPVTPAAAYFSGQNSSFAICLSKYTTSGTGEASFVVNASMGRAYRIVKDSSGNVYVPNLAFGDGNITKVSPSGAANTSWAVVPGVTYFSCAIDNSGNIYAASTGGATPQVTKVTPAGVTTAIWASLPAGTQPTGMVCDASGNVYIADPGSAKVIKIDTSGTVNANWASCGAGAQTYDVTIDPTGTYIYACNQVAATVSRVELSTATTIQTWATVNGTPTAITCDPSGNVYVNTVSNGIAKITSGGVVTLNWASGGGSNADIVSDSSGNLYVGGSPARKITPAGVTTAILPGGAYLGVVAMT